MEQKVEQIEAIRTLEASSSAAVVAVMTDQSALSMPPVISLMRTAPALGSDELVREALAKLGDNDRLLWTRTPNGRFSVNRLDKPHPSEAQWQARWRGAEEAGWDVVALAIEAGRLSMLDIAPETRQKIATSRGCIGSAAAPLRRSVWDYERRACTELRIADLTEMRKGDQVPWLVRTLEAMASSKEALQQSGGRVMLTFEGYESSPHEVWDCPRVQAFMKRLVEAVPWWPCLIHRTHAFVWVAASLQHTKTRYMQDGEAFVDMDPVAVRQAMVAWCSAAMGVIADSGLQDHGAGLIDETIRPLLGFVQRFDWQAGEVSRERLRLLDERPAAIDPVTWSQKFGRPVAGAASAG